jgi:rhomboid protease GluP
LRNRTQVGREIRSHYTKWAIYGIALGLLGLFSVDNWAHVGGLAGGFAVAYVAGTPVHASRVGEEFWKALAGASVLATAFCFWEMYLQFTGA